MFKAFALASLSIAFLCTGAAFADNQHGPPIGPSSNQDWSPVVKVPHLPKDLKDWCVAHHEECNRGDGWQDHHDKGNPMPAPEVDPAGDMGALTILACVLAMVRGRRRVGQSA